MRCGRIDAHRRRDKSLLKKELLAPVLKGLEADFYTNSGAIIGSR